MTGRPGKKHRVSAGAAEAEGVRIPYTLDRGARKHLYFVVREGRLTVRAPYAAKEEWVRQAVLGKSGWILGKLAESGRRTPPHPLRDGDRVSILGRALTVCIRSGTAGAQVFQEDGRLYIRLAPRADGAGEGSAEASAEQTGAAAVRALDEYRRGVARTEIPAAFERMRRLCGLTPARVSLRKMTGSWGRCHADGSITVNIRLVDYPPEAVDYVALHELCHLVYFSHSEAFWALVARYMPDYRRRAALLREPALWPAADGDASARGT